MRSRRKRRRAWYKSQLFLEQLEDRTAPSGLGGEYVASTGTVTSAPGETCRTIVVESIDDSDAKLDETFILDVTDSGGATIADSLGTLVDDDVLSIDFPSFPDPTGLNLVGAATTANDVLRLTPDANQTGAAWCQVPQLASVGFETTFDFRIADKSWSGLAFVIQGDSGLALGGPGHNLGYGHMPNSLAIEFDAGRSGPELTADPSDSHVSVHTRGPGQNRMHEAFSLGSVNTEDLSPGFKVDDGQAHTATIQYDAIVETLTIYLDDPGLLTPALTVSVDLFETLDLDGGLAWVGFTSAGSWNHDVLTWEFTSQSEASPAITIADVEQYEAADGATTDFVFTVKRVGPAVDLTVNLATADGTALAGQDYVAKSETLHFDAANDTRTFTVTVNGDAANEGRECFFVNIVSAAGALIADDQARGSILDKTPGAVFELEALLSGNGSAGFVVPTRGVGDTVGDINGDGFDDLGFADTAANGGAGEVRIVYGAADGFPAEFDLGSLDGTNGFVINGDAGDGVGWASSAGDFNGDESTDLLVRCGPDKQYVIFGAGGAFPPSFDLASVDGSNGFAIVGPGALDNSTTIGDINGDGFADLAVSYPWTEDFAGRTYVIFGKADGFSASFQLTSLLPENGGDGTAGFVLDGIDAWDLSGIYIAADRVDFNGDGLGDLFMGALFADPNGQNSGECYLVYGNSSFPPLIELSTLDESNGCVIHGAVPGGLFSGAGSAGDVNGDGFDDVVIHDGDASSYVILGRADMPSVFEVSSLSGVDGFKIIGIDETDLVHSSVTTPGDMNGDGFDDVIVHAGNADPGGVENAGETYVVFGSADVFPANVELAALDGVSGFVLHGMEAYDHSGSIAASAGDLNGDGFDDLMTQAQFTTAKDGYLAECYVVFGSDRTDAVTHCGTRNSDLLSGDTGANVMVGGQGDDTLVGAGGSDVLRGGQGDDVLAVSDLGFARIVGGLGSDTLRLDGGGLSLDLTAIPDNRIMGVEEIDVRGSGANALTLNLLEVLNLSDTSNTLIVRADSGDTIDLGAGWTHVGTQTVGQETFEVYTQGAATVLYDETDSNTTITIDDAVCLEGELTLVELMVPPPEVASFSAPHDIELGPDGNIYVNNCYGGSVLRYDVSTGEFDVFVEANSGGFDNSVGMDFGPDGNLYVASWLQNRVAVFDGTTGAYLREFIAPGYGGLDSPRGLVFGPDDNLYVASEKTHSVLKYDGSTGNFLGEFVPDGSGGNGGTSGITFGPDGNLYVTRYGGNHVCRYDGTTGELIDVFADQGDPNNPQNIEFGPDGDLYLSSWGDNRVLHYDGATGDYLDDFVPPGDSGLANPWGLLFDLDGHFLVVGTGGKKILRYYIEPHVTLCVTLSSPTWAPVTADFATADVSANAGSDYFATSGTLTFEPGETAATIIVPTIDDFVPEDDETFVVDLSNPNGATLRDAQGVVTIKDDDGPPSISIDEVTVIEGDNTPRLIDDFVFARTGGLMEPRGLAIGPDGDLYVASSYPAGVLRYEGESGSFLGVFADASSAGPVDARAGEVLFGPDGHLYVTTGQNDSVLKFDGTTGNYLSEFVTPGLGGLDAAWGMAFGPDGDLYVGSSATDEVLRYHPGSAASEPATFVGVFASGYGLDAPWTLTFGPDGDLYVGSGRTDEVLRFQGPLASSPGTFIDTFIPAGSGGLDGPRDLTFHSDGNLYVVSKDSNQVLRYDAATGAFIDVYADAASGLAQPHAAVFSSDGNLLVSNRDAHNVLRYGPASQAVFTVTLSLPVVQAVTVSFATNNGSAVAGSDYVASSGTVTFALGETSKKIVVPTIDDPVAEGDETFFVQLSNPTGATLTDAQGVATIDDDDGASAIRITDVTVTEGDDTPRFLDTFITSHGELAYASKIAFQPSGDLLVGSVYSDTVWRYDGSTGEMIEQFIAAGSGGLQYPGGLAYGPDGYLYVCSQGTDQVLRYDGLTGAFDSVFVDGSGGLDWPFELTFDTSGNLYVSSRSTNNVLKSTKARPGRSLGSLSFQGPGG